MGNFVGNTVSSGGIIYAADHNELVNRIGAVINGGLDDTNIGSLSGSKINGATVPAAALATSINPNTLLGETINPFVQTGCTWSTVSGLNGTMSSGTVYASHSGQIFRIPVSSIASHAFTASKDTYIDIDYTGNITYNEVANGASAPVLTADSVRVAKVVTGLSSISSVTQTAADSNGVQIYPVSPFSVWQSWTPALTNITVGNGSLTGRFVQIGKLVKGIAIFQSGSSTTFANVVYQISLPVPYRTTPGAFQKAGRFSCYDSVAGVIYDGAMQLASTTSAFLLASFNGAASNTLNKLIGISSSNFNPPVTGSGSYWEFNFDYEAA